MRTANDSLLFTSLHYFELLGDEHECKIPSSVSNNKVMLMHFFFYNVQSWHIFVNKVMETLFRIDS